MVDLERVGDLREDAALRSLALRLSSQYGGEPDEAAFLASVDRGLEPPRGTGERCWVLDPIDGTKGFMTGQHYPGFRPFRGTSLTRPGHVS